MIRSIRSATAIVATLALITPAYAGPERVREGRALAVKVTGQVCQGEHVPIERGWLPDGILARATYFYPAGRDDDPDTYFNCRITFRRGHIPCEQFAGALIHEYRHLDGWRAQPGHEYIRSDGAVDSLHSRHKWSPMYPGINRISPRVKQVCR
jgi:hypothetical protein